MCNKKVLIGSFYIHQRFSDWDLVEVGVEQASKVCSYLILLGDFNQDMLIERKKVKISVLDNPSRVTLHSST